MAFPRFNLFGSGATSGVAQAQNAFAQQQRKMMAFKQDALDEGIRRAQNAKPSEEPTINHYIAAAESMRDRVEAEFGPGTWTPAVYSDLSSPPSDPNKAFDPKGAIHIRGYTLREEDIGKAETASGGKFQIKCDNSFFEETRFNPATTLNESKYAPGAHFLHCTFDGMQNGDVFALRKGGQYVDVNAINIKGGTFQVEDQATIHGFHVQGAFAHFDIGSGAKIVNMHAEQASILSLTMAKKASITAAVFDGATIGANSSVTDTIWTNVDFNNTNLDSVDFSRAQLTDVHFVGAHMQGMNLAGAALKDTTFVDVDISQINGMGSANFKNVQVTFGKNTFNINSYAEWQKAKDFQQNIQQVGGMLKGSMDYAQRVAQQGWTAISPAAAALSATRGLSTGILGGEDVKDVSRGNTPITDAAKEAKAQQQPVTRQMPGSKNA